MDATQQRRFEEEIHAMSIDDLQLILEDQRDLYSKEELEYIADILAAKVQMHGQTPKGNLKKGGSPNETQSPEKERSWSSSGISPITDEEETYEKEHAKENGEERTSSVAPWLEGTALTTSILSLIISIVFAVREENINIFLGALGSCIVLMLICFSAAEALRFLADIATSVSRTEKRTKKPRK